MLLDFVGILNRDVGFALKQGANRAEFDEGFIQLIAILFDF